MKNVFLHVSLLTLIAAAGCGSQDTSVIEPVASKEASKPASVVKKPKKSLKEKAQECICPQMWMPGCGEDKKTYGNSCEAKCAGVDYTIGECLKNI